MDWEKMWSTWVWKCTSECTVHQGLWRCLYRLQRSHTLYKHNREYLFFFY